MHHCGHSSEGSCRVLTDICVPSGAIICQAMHHDGHSSEGSCRVLTDICTAFWCNNLPGNDACAWSDYLQGRSRSTTDISKCSGATTLPGTMTSCGHEF